jgi:hypothetical protein
VQHRRFTHHVLPGVLSNRLIMEIVRKANTEHMSSPRTCSADESSDNKNRRKTSLKEIDGQRF